MTEDARPLTIHGSGGGDIGRGRSRTPATSRPGIQAQPAPGPGPNLFVPGHAPAGLAPTLRRRGSPSPRRHRRGVWRPAAEAAAAGRARGGGGGRLRVGSSEEQPSRGHRALTSRSWHLPLPARVDPGSFVVRGLTGGEPPAACAGEGGDGAVLRPRPPPRPGRRLPRLLQGPAHAPALPPDRRARQRGKHYH